MIYKYQICWYISIKYNKIDKNACKLIILNQPTNQHNRFINLHNFWSIYIFVIVFLFIYFHVLSFFMLHIHSYIMDNCYCRPKQDLWVFVFGETLWNDTFSFWRFVNTMIFLSLFQSVSACWLILLGRSVKTNSAFALCKQKDVRFYLNLDRRDEIRSQVVTRHARRDTCWCQVWHDRDVPWCMLTQVQTAFFGLF